ncbi:MAG: DNA polymerase III subunit gamma/tau [Bacteroidetes bacterium]|nr:DNA polymerase III subunit gamma/tau [Bacteroidota bacterium]
MEQFIVSARKYRPGTFESVVGQGHVTQTLKNAIRNNHLAQAFLFCGPRGVGKTTCARILAKTINCSNLKDSIEPCNECESCVSFNKNASFNIYELDAASNNSVDDIRALVEQVRYAPQGARYKIYIIDEVHMLSTAAFNAFLKTLEEPPPYAIFILATTERHKILPTILSRCQIFDFNRITISSMVEHLNGIAEKEKVEVEQEALHVIAEKADGALRDALSIFDQMVSFSGDKLTYESVIRNLNILDYDYYFRTMDLVQAEDSSGLLILMDEILKKGFDSHLYLGGLCDHIRNLLICKDEQTRNLLEVAESAAIRYDEQSKVLSSSFLFNALQLASQYDASFKAARNQRLHVELALLKLANLNRALQLTAAPVPAEEKKTSVVKEIIFQAPENKTDASKPLAQKEETPEVSEAPKEKVISEAPKSSLPPVSLHFNPNAQPKTEILEEEGPKAVSAPQVQGTARLPLTKEKASAIWMEFAESMGKQNKMTLATGMKKAELLLENRQLKAEVSGKHVAEFITEIKSELVAYMNSRLETELDGIYITVGKSNQEGASPYTLEEKLNAMAKTNPQLPDFMKDLGLELDY